MPGPGESLLKLMDSSPGPTGLQGMKTDMQICRRQTDQLQSGETAHVGRKNKAARCNNRWTSCNLGAGCEGVLLGDGLTQGMSSVISEEAMGWRASLTRKSSDCSEKWPQPGKVCALVTKDQEHRADILDFMLESLGKILSHIGMNRFMS